MKLPFLVLIEVTYALVTRLWLPRYFSGEIEREAAVTLVRIATIPIYWLIFRDVIGKLTSDGKAIRQKAFWVGAALFVAVPIVVPVHPLFARGSSALFFALTSFVVGFREELVYRAVLQNVLEQEWGLGMALVGSNILFVMYHVGAVPISLVSIFHLFVGGCLLGLVYVGSRSLVAASLVHGAYDAVASFGPYFQNSRPGLSVVVMEAAALAILARWMWRNAKLQW